MVFNENYNVQATNEKNPLRRQLLGDGSVVIYYGRILPDGSLHHEDKNVCVNWGLARNSTPDGHPTGLQVWNGTWKKGAVKEPPRKIEPFRWRSPLIPWG